MPAGGTRELRRLFRGKPAKGRHILPQSAKDQKRAVAHPGLRGNRNGARPFGSFILRGIPKDELARPEQRLAWPGETFRLRVSRINNAPRHKTFRMAVQSAAHPGL